MATGILIFVVVVLVGLSISFIGSYNGLVNLRNQVERAWSNIDVILKQRFDEIPQLVKTIEQYAGYEAGVLKQLADARANYGQARSIPEKINASQQMSIALQGIGALGEAYPELKANQNFVQLQTRISQLENSIADRRESYNEAVAVLNARIDQFPDLFAARLLGYSRQQTFQATVAERATPSVKMDLPKFG